MTQDEWTRRATIDECGLFYRYRERRGWPGRLGPPDEAQVTACIEWLKEFARPLKQVNRRRHSNEWRAIVEQGAGRSISNGAFLEAARRLGYEFHWLDRGFASSPFAYLNLGVGRRLPR